MRYQYESNCAVKQAKKIMRKAKTSGNDPQMALLDVRNTPMEGYGVSPAQLLMSRRTKTKLPTSENHLKPRVVENIAEKIQKRQNNQHKYYNEHSKTLVTLQKEDLVRMQPFGHGK